MRKTTILAALLASFGLFTTTAHAEPGKNAKKEKGNDYGYTFEDDSLLGGEMDGRSDIIKIRPTGVRDRLIRPRVQFVPELLKSVENL